MKIYRITSEDPDDGDSGVVYQSDNPWHVSIAIDDLFKFSAMRKFIVEELEIEDDECFRQSGNASEEEAFN